MPPDAIDAGFEVDSERLGESAGTEPLKRAQERLRESETRLQAFFENSPNLVFIKDRQGRYLYVNNEFERALRITEEQIKGKRDDEIFPLEQAVSFQTNDRQVLEAGVPMEFEEVALQEDGPHTSIVHKFPLLNAEGEIYAIGGIATDITTRKRAEMELLGLRDELTAELTAMARLHELRTRLLSIEEFHALLEEFLEDLRSGCHAGFARGQAMKLRERVIIEDVETDFEFAPHRHVAASAGFRAVQSTPLLSRPGELLGMLSTHFRKPHRLSLHDLRFTDLYARHLADILERKQAQHALQLTQAELARVSRVTTMGELAASIAHEINQPLAAVTNNSSACLRLLADDILKPQVLRRALEQIVVDATRASAVIARIRTFLSKAPAEKSELEINEVIEEALALARHELHENQVLLERRLTNSLPLVLGDRVQLQQVLLNLVKNANEAMAAVTDRPRLLRVESRIDEPGKVLVEVGDSGSGLGSDADQVFTPFFTTKANGMGMGLSISRSLIEAHGGRLWATPNSPHGAVFYFTLPADARNPS